VTAGGPWAANLGTTSVTLYAHHVGHPVPAGPISATPAPEAPGLPGLPRASVQLPEADAGRLVALLDVILAHPAYAVWAETSAPASGRFEAVRGGRAAVVLLTGPMRAELRDHPADAGDPGDPPYRETVAEVAYEDLAALREALALAGAGS
jgi:hypothetical protein